jgi:MoaA/NifB/PqqE/SkfB family radical SAM enzyme
LPLNQGRRELTRDEIRRMFSHLQDQGLRYAIIQGGEPLLRPDTPAVLEDLSALGYSMTLVTNGSPLSERTIRCLSVLPLSIAVSLDTLDRETYKRIRGADLLPQTRAGIDRLAGFPGRKMLTCIISRANLHHVEEVVHFARARGFEPVIGAYHWGIGRYGRSDPELIHDLEQAAGVLDRILAQGLVSPGLFRDYAEDTCRWLRGSGLAGCDAGKRAISIGVGGEVAPCLALAPVGSLADTSLDEILARFDRGAIAACSDASSCNLLCARAVGAVLRRPVAALMTALAGRRRF